MKESERELEIIKLKEIIRQKTIAISTIHTIHRLLTSVLNLDELLIRIARLIQQILKVRYCSIKILSNDKKFLITKVTVYKGKELKKTVRRLKIGYGIEGNCAAKGKGFLNKEIIAVPLISEDAIGVITVKYKLNKTNFDNSDLEILSTLAEQATVAIKNAQLYEDQERMLFGSIKSLANLLDARSPNTYTHSELFVRIVLEIAEELKLTREEIRDLHYAALLPDAGKFGVPEEILKKPCGLSGKEYKIVKRHPLDSVKIIQPIEILKPVIPIILHHHERYDGTGYPDGLKKDKIPIGSRIMAVAEAFEAMGSQRPYRGATTISKAIKEIKRNKGTQFDPNVVEAFLRVIKKMKNLMLILLIVSISFIASCASQSSIAYERQEKRRITLLRAKDIKESIKRKILLEPITQNQAKGGVEVTVKFATQEELTEFFMNRDIFGTNAGRNPFLPNMLVFYVKISNQGNEKIKLDPQEFVMIDDLNIQYSYLTPEYIAVLLETRGTIYTIARTAEAAPGLYGAGAGLAKGVTGGPSAKKRFLLMQSSLSGGYVYKGIVYDGYIAFFKPNRLANSLRLLITNIKTSFGPDDRPLSSTDFEFGFKIISE